MLGLKFSHLHYFDNRLYLNSRRNSGLPHTSRLPSLSNCRMLQNFFRQPECICRYYQRQHYKNIILVAVGPYLNVILRSCGCCIVLWKCCIFISCTNEMSAHMAQRNVWYFYVVPLRAMGILFECLGGTRDIKDVLKKSIFPIFQYEIQLGCKPPNHWQVCPMLEGRVVDRY